MRHIVSLSLIIALLIMGLLWSGRSMASIVRVDFNRDGQRDMAVANSGSDDVSILLADSKGGFVRATNFSVGKAPRALAAGDFNGDGSFDLAVANSGSNDVSILLGDGKGGF